MAGPQQRRWQAALVTLALLAILVLAFITRLDGLDASFWGDEVRTHDRAFEPVHIRLASDTYPLYYFLAHMALYLGDNEVTLRLPALLAGLAGVVAIFFVGKSLYSATAGLVAALALAVSPFHILHSHHARYYTLVMLFGLLTAWFLARAASQGKARDWVAYAFSGFLGLMSHVMFAPCLLAMSVGGLLYIAFARRSSLNGPKWRRLAALILCTFLAGLPTAIRIGPHHFKALSLQQPRDDGDSAEAGPAVGDGAEGDAQAPPAAESEQDEGHLLAFFGNGGYLEFLKRYFWISSPRIRDLLILLAIWGLVELFRNHAAMGAIIASLLVLTPLPFFYVPVQHWHHARYYSAAYLPALLLVAIGIMILPSYLARVLILRRREPAACPGPAKWVRPVEAALVALFLAALAPAAVDAMRTYRAEGWLTENRVTGPIVPVRDWKGLYRHMANTFQTQDVVFHLGPPEHAANYRRLYLDRYLGNYGALPFREVSRNHPKFDLIRWACLENPYASVWFTGQRRLGIGAYVPLLNALCGPPLMSNLSSSSMGVALWVLGEPTQNLIENGGFEQKEVVIGTEGPGAVGIDPGYEGRGTLAMYVPPEAPASQTVTLSVKPHTYRVRNGHFELWAEGKPVGWEMAAESAHAVEVGPATTSGSRALGLAPSATPVVLSQRVPMGLAPGRRVRVEAEAYADAARQIALILRYALAGEAHEAAAYHSGGGEWAPLFVEAVIPAEADPEAIAVVIRREPDTPGQAAVDNVAVGVLDADNSLDPREIYTLSMMIRYADVRRPKNPYHPWGYVALTFSSEQDERRHVDLARFEGTRDWYQLSCPVLPGRTLPADAADLHVRVGMQDASGAIWIDNVQLEPKDHATPFTQGVRIPHDEDIALRGLP